MIKAGTPIIGVCISKSRPALHQMIRKRMELYPGSPLQLLAFRMEDLDFGKRKVKGELWAKELGTIDRIKGNFPAPSVIYIQCPIAHQVIKRIERELGCNVFNNFIFDKWECWELLGKDNNLRSYLPETCLFKHHINLERFLKLYKDVYLKPIDKACGNGIFRVKLNMEGTFEVLYHEKNQRKWRVFDTFQTMCDWLNPFVSAETYIIQQTIQEIQTGEPLIEIRLQMNKVQAGNWKVSYLIYRCAKEGYHISNRNEQIISIHYVQRTFSLGRKKIGGIRQQIVNLGHKICQAFDSSGHHMADLGIDLAIDRNGRLWILEVNPLPFPYHPPNQEYAFTRPIEYGVSLSRNRM